MNEPTPPSRTAHLAHHATLAGYDRWAAHYDATPNPMVAATAWAWRTAPIDLTGRRVVEFGCGTGRHASLVLAAGARSYTGIDGSPGMLREAASRHGLPGANWVQGSLHATPFATASFDGALVVLVLEHLQELAPLFTEIARVLAPGGVLRLLEIHHDLLAAGTVAHFHDAGVERRFTSTAHATATIVAALTAAGFVIAHCRELAADGELLAAVPKLAKHTGRRVLLDLLAVREETRGTSTAADR